MTRPARISVPLPRKGIPAPVMAYPRRRESILEVALSITGVAMALFMLSHLGLLFSVLLGASTMDALASFLERYYLLQAFAPIIVLIALAHILLSVRKAPTTVSQQWVLTRQINMLRHFDTWSWAVQALTGAAMVALGAIHLWIILAGLPIQAAKSGLRVFSIYLWFYIPFILLVETHLSVGMYRVFIKWGILSRRWSHAILTAWTILVLVLGFAILATLYLIGANL